MKFQALLYLVQDLGDWGDRNASGDRLQQGNLPWKESVDRYQAYETIHVRHPPDVFFLFFFFAFIRVTI